VDGGVAGFVAAKVWTKGGGGCAFILPDGGRCGAELKPGSSYCDTHHALCHLPEGSTRERRRLREAEALARAVGGRQGDHQRAPSDRFLRRLENVAKGFVRPKRSRIVRKDGE